MRQPAMRCETRRFIRLKAQRVRDHVAESTRIAVPRSEGPPRAAPLRRGGRGGCLPPAAARCRSSMWAMASA